MKEGKYKISRRKYLLSAFTAGSGAIAGCNSNQVRSDDVSTYSGATDRSSPATNTESSFVNTQTKELETTTSQSQKQEPLKEWPTTSLNYNLYVNRGAGNPFSIILQNLWRGGMFRGDNKSSNFDKILEAHRKLGQFELLNLALFSDQEAEGTGAYKYIHEYKSSNKAKEAFSFLKYKSKSPTMNNIRGQGNWLLYQTKGYVVTDPDYPAKMMDVYNAVRRVENIIVEGAIPISKYAEPQKSLVSQIRNSNGTEKYGAAGFPSRMIQLVDHYTKNVNFSLIKPNYSEYGAMEVDKSENNKENVSKILSANIGIDVSLSSGTNGKSKFPHDFVQNLPLDKHSTYNTRLRLGRPKYVNNNWYKDEQYKYPWLNVLVVYPSELLFKKLKNRLYSWPLFDGGTVPGIEFQSFGGPSDILFNAIENQEGIITLNFIESSYRSNQHDGQQNKMNGLIRQYILSGNILVSIYWP